MDTPVLIGIALVVIVVLLIVVLKSKKPAESSTPVESTPKPTNAKVTLPSYPPFDHTRLMEMGLSQEEALEYIQELIAQVETQIPLIQKALESSSFEEMERLTHSIKGSATTIGVGGIANQLIDFNTYLKSKKDIPTLQAYTKQLIEYTQQLKKQYA